MLRAAFFRPTKTVGAAARGLPQRRRGAEEVSRGRGTTNHGKRSHVALGFARALADVNYDTSELRSNCGGHGCQQQRADGKKNSTRAPLAEPTGEVAVRGRFHLPMIINPARFGRQ